MAKPIQFYEGWKLNPSINKAMPKDIDPYLPGEKLVKAVKLAQILNRPLLIKGEPGCGKTRLAQAVAYELFSDLYKNFYFEWHVKSNSKAQEGLYIVNNLKRLHDANLRKKTSLDIKFDAGSYKGDYLELGPLGKAFALTNTMDQNFPPPVVLIDEIDKADIDFPNDLLLELDQMKFSIPESNNGTGNPIEIVANKSKKPLIIITSNDEKPLPAAFLRRCLFHFIDFPNPQMLQQIVEAKFPELKQNLAKAATGLFDALRTEIKNAGTATKNISTSELLDWVKLIEYHQELPGSALDNDKVGYEQALAKDVETLQIFMKHNEERDKTTKDGITKLKEIEPAVI